MFQIKTASLVNVGRLTLFRRDDTSSFFDKVLVLNYGLEFPPKHSVKMLHFDCVAIIRPFCLWSGRFCHDLRVMNIMSRLLIQMAGIIVRYRVSVLIFHARSEAHSSSRGSEEERCFLLVQRILQRSALHLNVIPLKQCSTQLGAVPSTDSASCSKGTRQQCENY